MRRFFRFIRYNKHLWLSVLALIYSARYRVLVLRSSGKKMQRKFGYEGLESQDEETPEHYKYGRAVGYAVEHVCSRTSWESKCLVRALTAQRLLKRKHIDSTMYLGCRLEEKGEMVAHAWLRCGRLFVTGGNGDGYAMVSKFAAYKNPTASPEKK